MRAFANKILILLVLVVSVLALVYIVWVDIWIRPETAVLMNRRATLEVGALSACPSRALVGTVAALGGQMLDAGARGRVALAPDLVAIAALKSVAIVPERDCRPVLHQVDLRVRP